MSVVQIAQDIPATLVCAFRCLSKYIMRYPYGHLYHCGPHQEREPIVVHWETRDGTARSGKAYFKDSGTVVSL